LIVLTPEIAPEDIEILLTEVIARVEPTGPVM
jgi:hypothetical protein